MNTPEVRITILVDNNVSSGLMPEHGLSLWIETQGKKTLFDTGQGKALLANARALDVNLGETDILVLSHGHYDHTGGIQDVLRASENVEIYCHPDVMKARYSVSASSSRSIGMQDDAMTSVKNLPRERMHWVTRPTMLSDRIGITGPVPRETDYEDTGGPFFLDIKGTEADSIDDDLALWIQIDDGLVICAGCSHSGIVNTLNHVRTLTDNLPIRSVIGGFHLCNASNDRLEQTAKDLETFEIDLLVPCHCTGEAAVDLLRNRFGESVSIGAAGMVCQF